MKKTPPISKRITPRDLRRLGELTGRELTQAEKAEENELLTRLLEWAEFRDLAGDAHRAPDGSIRADCTDRRLRRTLRATQNRSAAKDRERERLEGILAAVEQGGNIFARMGDLWLVAFEGRRAFIPDNKGMPYLFEILKQAASDAGNDGGLTPSDLCREAHLPPPDMLPDQNKPRENKEEDEQGETTEADRNAIDHRDAQDERGLVSCMGFRMTPEQYKHAVTECKKELSDAIKTGDKEAAKAARKLLRKLGEGDPKGRRRRAPDPAKEKARVRVANAIRRALADIERVQPAAAKHLRATVRTDSGRYTYQGPKFTT